LARSKIPTSIALSISVRIHPIVSRKEHIQQTIAVSVEKKLVAARSVLTESAQRVLTGRERTISPEGDSFQMIVRVVVVFVFELGREVEESVFETLACVAERRIRLANKLAFSAPSFPRASTFSYFVNESVTTTDRLIREFILPNQFVSVGHRGLD
jgi:hypothetical protein